MASGFQGLPTLDVNTGRMRPRDYHIMSRNGDMKEPNTNNIKAAGSQENPSLSSSVAEAAPTYKCTAHLVFAVDKVCKRLCFSRPCAILPPSSPRPLVISQQ